MRAASVTEQVISPLPPVILFTVNVNQGGDLVVRPEDSVAGRAKFSCSRQVVLGGCAYDVVHLIVHVPATLVHEASLDGDDDDDDEDDEAERPLFSKGHFIGFAVGDQCIKHDDNKQKLVSWEYVHRNAEHVMGGVLVRVGNPTPPMQATPINAEAESSSLEPLIRRRHRNVM